MRFRYVYMVIFSVAVMLGMFLTDPDLGIIQNLHYGAGLVATISMTSLAVIYVTMIHISRRALFDYIDMEDLYKKASETPNGAGMVFLGISLAMVSLAIVISTAAR